MSAIGPVAHGPLIDLWIGPNDPRGMVLAVTGVANQADLQAFQVSRPVTVSKCRIWIVVSSGNIDVGLYDSTGAKLATSGSTAVGTGAAEQVLNLSASVTLVPGRLYFAAVAFDNATVSSHESGNLVSSLEASIGIGFRYSSSFPLPVSFTVTPGGASPSNRHWTPVFTA